MQTKVAVEGLNWLDVRAAVGLGSNPDKQHWLVINPVLHIGAHTDYRDVPAETFDVTWTANALDGRSEVERFTRRVTSVKELQAVLKPLLAAHIKAKKDYDAHSRKMNREYKRNSIASAKKAIAAAEKHLENAKSLKVD